MADGLGETGLPDREIFAGESLPAHVKLLNSTTFPSTMLVDVNGMESPTLPDKASADQRPAADGSSGRNRRRSCRGSASSICGRTSTTPTVSSAAASLAGSSSSSGAEESNPQPAYRRRRRRHRRRTLSSRDEEIRLIRRKTACIETALLNCDRDRLAQLAVSRGGLVSDEIRVRVWPRLMGIDLLETDITLPTEEEIKNHPEYNQVVLDVNRSLKRFPPGIGEAERPALQEQLTRLIMRVIMAHPRLHYYQGYHDVAITFLLVVGEELGYHIVERLSVSHLKEFMAPTMEQTVRLLQYIYPIFRRKDPELFAYLQKAELGTIFALPWLITWFGHVLPDYGDVVRLYDYFLAQPPLMPIYLAAAIVLHRREDILLSECDMATLHSLLSRIPQDLPFEKLLVESQLLYEEFPPHSLQQEASEQSAALVVSPAAASSHLTLVALLTRAVLFGAPVVFGILFVRLYGSVLS